jgi:dihydroxy-acid dehydratase
MQLVRDDVRPSQIVTRDALENAAASVAATGGSTNGVLHLLAIARELDIPFSIDDFDRIAGRTPIVASLKPGGEFVATDIFDAGAWRWWHELAKREAGARGRTVDGHTLGESPDQVVETPGSRWWCRLTAIKPTGGLASCVT